MEIFSDRNTSFYRNFDQQPLEYKIDKFILIVSIYVWPRFVCLFDVMLNP